MPNLSEIRQFVRAHSAHDYARQRSLEDLHDHTKRHVILYAVNFSQPTHNIPSHLVEINDSDVQHFMSVISELRKNEKNKCRKLDLIVHSPGGSLAAAEQIVCYLREQYSHIRMIVPQNAMSAATMMACAADEILMGSHSALGPTDPQVHIGGNSFAAQSIINEFNNAKKEIKEDMTTLPLWTSRMGNWPTGLLDHCQRAIELSQEMVSEWLEKYMKLTKAEAENAAKVLADANEHKTHDRPLSFDKINKLKLKVKRLEDEQKLQDLVLSVFHATTVTFEYTTCIKIVENHLGKGVYQSPT